MTTILVRPAVAKYLGELDAALAGHPVNEASDLREQIREHIQDSLAANATDEQVADVLDRLGAPSELIPTTVASSDPRTPALVWLKQRPWPFWAVVAVIVLVVGSVGEAWRIESNIAAVQGSCTIGCRWLDPNDDNAGVLSEAGGVQQVTVPQRLGYHQMFTFTLYNPSRHSQKLLGGPDYRLGAPFNPTYVKFSAEDPDKDRNFDVTPRRYVSSVTIAPHGYRQVQVDWVQKRCVLKGNVDFMGGIQIRTRALAVDRTVEVDFGETFAIIGPSNPDHCIIKKS